MTQRSLGPIVVLLVLFMSTSIAVGAPDVILHGGKIVTVNADFDLAEAIAIDDGKISQVGSDAEILATRGEQTRVIDLQGKIVLPGLMDSHVHAANASMHEFNHPIPEMHSINDVLEYVRRRATELERGEWIWVNQVFITRLDEQRYPTRAELDQAAPNHPVVFSTGPDAMLNSLALERSGIDKDFVAVGPGKVERDPQTGEPTGMLRSAKRYIKAEPSASRDTEEDRRQQLKKLLRDYNAVGLTSVADRNASSSIISRYQSLAADGELTLRIALSHAVGNDDSRETVVKNIREVANHPLCRPDPMLRIVGIKMFLDGGMLTGSAYMREPWGISQIYAIDDPRYRGVLFIEPDDLEAYVQAAVESGLQFTAHSVGDGAVHNLIDAYEKVNKTTSIAPTRPCITHCNFMSGEAISRMAKLDIVADIQPAWLYLDTRTLQNQFGYDRLRYFQPLKSLFEAGVVVGGGSDHMQKIGSFRSVNPYNPFLGMWITITRQARRYDGELHPEEALTREQAIRFYTTNNAYIMFLDDEVGSLESGKFADLIVLDRDILQCPVDDIKGTQVLQTWMNGQLVYSADEASPAEAAP